MPESAGKIYGENALPAVEGANMGVKGTDEPPDADLLLAAAYVYDAQYNRNIPFETSPKSVRLYYFYNHWGMQTATYFFIFVDLSLALFEEPAVCAVPFLATSLVEVLCLLAFFVRLVHFANVIPRSVFWKDTKNICVMVTIMLNLVDLIIYGALSAANVESIRWSRVLRPIFLINFAESRQVRRAFRSIRNTLPEILYVFLLFIFSVLMFSLMALKLFGSRKLLTVDGTSYFTNYLDAVFDLYVLVTTANSPDVMMPAFNYNWWYCLFFIAYIIINTYIFMSVFLAVVYNNYKKHLKNEIRKMAYMKHRKMVDAFHILKVKESHGFVIKHGQWNKLVKLVAPDISNSHRELLLRVSDDEQKGYVAMKDFVRLADLLNIKVITMKSRVHPLERWMPFVYKSQVSRFIRRMVQHKGFVYAFDVIIVVNAIFIALDEKNPLISYAEWVFLSLYIVEILMKLYTYEPKTFFAKNQFWNWFDTSIIVAALIVTIVNTALKAAPPQTSSNSAYSVKRYMCCSVVLGDEDSSGPRRRLEVLASPYSSQQILDIVFILRVLRLIRIVDSIQSCIHFVVQLIGYTIYMAEATLLLFFHLQSAQEKKSNNVASAIEIVQSHHKMDATRFRVIMNTLINIVPTMVTFGGLILAIYYVFAIVGIEAFKGKIRFFPDNSSDPTADYCGNPALRDSLFAKSKYCRNNFNDIGSAFIVLLELTVVNQWHVIASGFALVTHPVAKLYFIALHVVVVIIIINIFVAFILEAFFVEYSVEKSEVETVIEKKIQELGVGIQEDDVPDVTLVENMETPENEVNSGEEEKNSKALMFRIASKRYRTVDALLQRMFEAEILPEEEGPPMEDILNLSYNDVSLQNPTFDKLI